MRAIATRRGLIAWLASRWELMNVTVTLRAAEQDQVELGRQLAALPVRIRQLERDVGELRVRQAMLRSGD